MKRAILSLIMISIICSSGSVFAATSSPSEADLFTKRLELYQNMETILQIPWYYLAAADQYEHNLRLTRKDREKAKGVIGIYIEPSKWVGALNPNLADVKPLSISLFGGIGLDGDGDGRADINSDVDRLYTFANYLLNYGTDEENIRIGLWNYYKRDKTVSIIIGNARIYKTLGTLHLQEKAFPLPIGSHYTYRSTWGSARGWGGRRIHEGTDVFASYGVPVRSTCYGIIEMKGWNKYGGWRIGIRDLNNNYHYFAHLNGFANDLKVGQVVKPAQIIGSVGSTGYGPPGTSGKFPPHLHFGLYKDNGITEWSFDPYPYLKIWERNDRIKKK
ncbi:M23 family metallopeptidase [Peribacillus asahii]|uniref:M23 family metallopeptidase n=1 Tax=Peribacillus asahii TaxID=228899 RepID=UPI0026955801